jgi:hypothetical protein
MTRKLILLIAVFAIAGFAADVTGVWKGNMTMQDNPIEHTFVLKSAGNAVTGTLTVAGMGSEMKIEDGKIDGDKISMAVTMEFGKITFSGTVSGDEMKLSIGMDGGGPGGPGGDAMQLTVKRAK